MVVPDDAEFVAIAEVVKAVGLRGEVKLYPLIDWHAPLLESRFLHWEDGGEVAVSGSRPQGQTVVIRLAGCHDRDSAEALVGRQLGFARGDYRDPAFPRPGNGLPFRYLGREVQLPDGHRVGTVDEVRRFGNQDTLVVRMAGREILIPAVPPILPGDDGLDGPLVIDPPEGLLDVAGD